MQLHLNRLVDELLALWEGVRMWDPVRQQFFKMRAALLTSVQDNRAFRDVAGMHNAGAALNCCSVVRRATPASAAALPSQAWLSHVPIAVRPIPLQEPRAAAASVTARASTLPPSTSTSTSTTAGCCRWLTPSGTTPALENPARARPSFTAQASKLPLRPCRERFCSCPGPAGTWHPIGCLHLACHAQAGAPGRRQSRTSGPGAGTLPSIPLHTMASCG